MPFLYKNITPIFTGIILCICLSNAQTQSRFDNAEIKSQKVRGNIYMLEGIGGNIGLSVGEDGAFIIDVQFAQLSEKIVVAIRNITDKEIRFLLNTHFHGDHTSGNENFAKMGTLIFAHENIYKRLKEGTINRVTGDMNPPAPEKALPVVTYQNKMNLYINGEAVRIIHVAPAHTDGDTLIYFSESDVLHTGDVYLSETYPIIDSKNGGRFQGIVDGLNRIIEIAGPNTQIISGHGKITNETEVIAMRDMLMNIQDRISKLISEGQSLEQVVKAKPTATYDEQRIGQGGTTRRDQFITVVYSQLTEER